MKRKEGSPDLVFLPASGHQSEKLLMQYQISRELTEKTVIFIDKDKIHFKSTAIIKILQKKGGWWSLMGIFRIVPVFIRDAIYDWISGRRSIL